MGDWGGKIEREWKLRVRYGGVKKGDKGSKNCEMREWRERRREVKSY